MGEGRPQAQQKKILFFFELCRAGFRLGEGNRLGAPVEEAKGNWPWVRCGGGRAPGVGSGDGASNMNTI